MLCVCLCERRQSCIFTRFTFIPGWLNVFVSFDSWPIKTRPRLWFLEPWPSTTWRWSQRQDMSWCKSSLRREVKGRFNFKLSLSNLFPRTVPCGCLCPFKRSFSMYGKLYCYSLYKQRVLCFQSCVSSEYNFKANSQNSEHMLIQQSLFQTKTHHLYLLFSILFKISSLF